MPSPIANITYHRRMLESALSKPGVSPETLLSMSQQLDRLINHSMRVAQRSLRLCKPVCPAAKAHQPRDSLINTASVCRNQAHQIFYLLAKHIALVGIGDEQAMGHLLDQALHGMDILLG